jgi:hypothetical protein
MLVIPTIDPKKKIEQMVGKQYQLKFIVVLFMSTLAFIILYLTEKIFRFKCEFAGYSNWNFIGIKTPWTLENKEVCKLAYIPAIKFWIIGGLLIVLGSLTIDKSVFIYILFSVITVVPVVYSYLKCKELKN